MPNTLKTWVLATLLVLAAAFPARAFVVDSVPAGPIRVVVIDPGHGGEDSGAVGSGGTAEKDVTLSLAKKLASKLKKRLGLRVLLTRETDVFVPLEERTAFANRHKADIFISIHVNAASNRRANGVETYFLSFETSDEDARRVAAFENRVARAAGGDLGEGTDDLKFILFDLVNTEAHHESSRLAEFVHTSLLKLTRKENRGVKQAPFTVLAGATMPAILVEVGFISNPAEERWLSLGKDQSRIADSIADGVSGFEKMLGGGVSYVGFREKE
ncbi:MAG: N-acetylmuramoyl-L-alanine amidase [Thermodesulfobacteriota bacterium]